MPDTAAHLATLDDAVALLREMRDALHAGAAELLDASSAGRLLGISRAKFLELDGRGHVPARVTLGDAACARWSRRELLAWIDSGTPHRSLWTQTRAGGLRRTG